MVDGLMTLGFSTLDRILGLKLNVLDISLLQEKVIPQH